MSEEQTASGGTDESQHVVPPPAMPPSVPRAEAAQDEFLRAFLAGSPSIRFDSAFGVVTLHDDAVVMHLADTTIDASENFEN